MAKLKKRAAKKGAKVTAKHVVHGSVAQARRAPLWTGTLVSLGALLGASIAWVVARGRARGPVTT